MSFKKLSDPKVRLLVLNKYGSRCAYCGCLLSNTTLTIDHISALERQALKRHVVSGLNELDNFNPACQWCNSSKSDLSVEDWRYKLYRKVQYLIENDQNFKIAGKFGVIKINKKQSSRFDFYFEIFKPEV